MAKTPTKKAAPKVKAEKLVSEEKVKTFSPFDFVKAIQQSKVDLIRTSDNPDLAEKSYNAFLTNKALSFHVDSILHANEMNVNHQLNNIQQNDYYINTVRSMKRPHVWLKKSSDEDIQFLSEHFNINQVRAQETLNVIGTDKVAELRKTVIKGGVVGKK